MLSHIIDIDAALVDILWDSFVWFSSHFDASFMYISLVLFISTACVLVDLNRSHPAQTPIL